MSQKRLENKILYHFKDRSYLEDAMTHSSYANENQLLKTRCNERLEFLGDAVLELVVSRFLFLDYKDRQEGDLSKLRASIVCEPTLAICAREIGLGEELLLGKGEDATGGRLRDSVLSDAFEALIGAMYLDGGLEACERFIHRFVLTDIDRKKLFVDSKTIFQEMVQAKNIGSIAYVLTGENGPDHRKTFEVDVRVGDVVYGHGSGQSKKAAEQVAAYQAIHRMQQA